MSTNGSKAVSEATPLRITHLRLENWRNFPKVDVELARRVFIVGPNASGKSNLLDAIRFLHEVVAVGGGFQAAVKKRAGVSRLRSLSARRYPDISLRVAIGNTDERSVWTYEIAFTQDNRQRPYLKRETVTHRGTTVIQRPNSEDKADQARLSQTYLEQVNVNREFRAVADFLSTVRYLHIVPQLVREPERSVGRRDDPFGGDFLEQIARTNRATQNARLRRIQDALVIAVPQLKELQLASDERGVPHLRGRYEHWRRQGAWQSEDQFSDGTLRLLGLLWALMEGAGPLLLEEPELSLHSDVVRFIPQMLARVERRSGRQVLLSTHSTDILGDGGIGLDEVLLLQPEAEGTAVRTAKEIAEIVHLMAGGVSLADAVIPWTRPAAAKQLAFFGD